MAKPTVKVVVTFLFALEFFGVHTGLAQLQLDPNNVILRVYTANKTTTFKTSKLAADEIRSVNVMHPLIFIIHGWQASANSTWVQNMTYLLIKKQPCSVVTVDWSAYASSINYPAVATLVGPLGNLVGDFVVNVTRNNSQSLANVHLIGHSLGAHAAGYAGQRIFAKMKEKVARISGLDPAGPLFYLRFDDEKLSKGDALRVDVIHTNDGGFGYRYRLGTSDFFPNGGGLLQPGCTTDPCSHSRSHDLYIESIVSKRFIAVQCSSYTAYQAGRCNSKNTTIMGYDEPSTASGKYYLSTNANPPYARGNSFPRRQTTAAQ